MSTFTTHQPVSNRQTKRSFSFIRLTVDIVLSLLFLFACTFILVLALISYDASIPSVLAPENSEQILRNPEGSGYLSASARTWYEEVRRTLMSPLEVKGFYEQSHFQCEEQEHPPQFVSSPDQFAWVCRGNLRYNAETIIVIPESVSPSDESIFYIQVNVYPSS